MGFSSRAASKVAVSPGMETGWADNAAQNQGGLLNLDITEVAGGSTTDGVSISDAMAVAKFVAKPSWANSPFRAGVAAAGIDSGDYDDYYRDGPCAIQVKNETAATLNLAVGDFLVQSPTNDFAVPLYQAVAAGGAVGVANHAAHPVAFVRKAIAIGAGDTELVEAQLYAPARCSVETIREYLGDAPATFADRLVAVTRGPGWIQRAGIGVKTGGGAGTLTLGVKIGATSIFAVAPVVDNDCVDPFCSLIDTAAAGAGTGPGTGGSYGQINTANRYFGPNAGIYLSVTNGSSFVGTGAFVQIELMYV